MRWQSFVVRTFLIFPFLAFFVLSFSSFPFVVPIDDSPNDALFLCSNQFYFLYVSVMWKISCIGRFVRKKFMYLILYLYGGIGEGEFSGS